MGGGKGCCRTCTTGKAPIGQHRSYLADMLPDEMLRLDAACYEWDVSIRRACRVSQMSDGARCLRIAGAIA
jgi:hypothetical protein